MSSLAKRYAAALTVDRVIKGKGFPVGTLAVDAATLLTSLGFKVEPKPGFLQLPSTHTEGSQAEVQPIYNNLKGMGVSSLPSQAQVGRRYVVDLSSPVSSPGGNLRFTYKMYDGVGGFLVVSPTGNTYHLLGDGINPKVKTDAAFNKWLKTDPSFQALLSTGALSKNPSVSQPARGPRTQENTGTCPCCFLNVKLKNGYTVLHGYKRPGDGATSGRCFGVGYPPFEVSREGTRDYLAVIQQEIKGLESKKRAVGDQDTLPHPVFPGKVLDRASSDPSLWRQAVDQGERRVQQEILNLEVVEKILAEKIRSLARVSGVKYPQHGKPRVFGLKGSQDRCISLRDGLG